jgi:hypothetical protein
VLQRNFAVSFASLPFGVKIAGPLSCSIGAVPSTTTDLLVTDSFPAASAAKTLRVYVPSVSATALLSLPFTVKDAVARLWLPRSTTVPLLHDDALHIFAEMLAAPEDEAL